MNYPSSTSEHMDLLRELLLTSSHLDFKRDKDGFFITTLRMLAPPSPHPSPASSRFLSREALVGAEEKVVQTVPKTGSNPCPPSSSSSTLKLQTKSLQRQQQGSSPIPLSSSSSSMPTSSSTAALHKDSQQRSKPLEQQQQQQQQQRQQSHAQQQHQQQQQQEEESGILSSSSHALQQSGQRFDLSGALRGSAATAAASVAEGPEGPSMSVDRRKTWESYWEEECQREHAHEDVVGGAADELMALASEEEEEEEEEERRCSSSNRSSREQEQEETVRLSPGLIIPPLSAQGGMMMKKKKATAAFCRGSAGTQQPPSRSSSSHRRSTLILDEEAGDEFMLLVGSKYPALVRMMMTVLEAGPSAAAAAAGAVIMSGGWRVHPTTWLLRLVEDIFDARMAMELCQLETRQDKPHRAPSVNYVTTRHHHHHHHHQHRYRQQQQQFPSSSSSSSSALIMTMDAFLIDFFLKRYGLESLAMAALWELLCNLERTTSTDGAELHISLELFRFTINGSLDQEDLLFVLFCRQVVTRELAKSIAAGGGGGGGGGPAPAESLRAAAAAARLAKAGGTSAAAEVGPPQVQASGGMIMAVGGRGRGPTGLASAVLTHQQCIHITRAVFRGAAAQALLHKVWDELHALTVLGRERLNREARPGHHHHRGSMTTAHIGAYHLIDLMANVHHKANNSLSAEHGRATIERLACQDEASDNAGSSSSPLFRSSSSGSTSRSSASSPGLEEGGGGGGGGGEEEEEQEGWRFSRRDAAAMQKPAFATSSWRKAERGSSLAA